MTPLRQATMSALNESLVLDYVREQGETSRSAIATELGLSPASVSRIVTRLVRANLVVESASEAVGPGRPAARLQFNRRSGCVIAIDLGGTKCHGVVADMAGAVLVEDVRPTGAHGSPYETLIAAIETLTTSAASPLVAAAIGVPAIVDPVKGVVIGGPNVAWHDFPLLDQLRQVLSVPVLVDNDVKLAAMAEAWRGLGRGLDDFVTISIGTGVGAAIVANGELVRGGNNAAGELGYLLVSPAQLRDEHAHSLGGLERIITGPAIAERARTLLEDAAVPTQLESATVNSEAVVAAALAGDALAIQIVDEVLEALTITLVALTATAAPALVILDGGVGRSLEPYLGRIADAMGRHTPWLPVLAVSRLGPSSTVIGAIASALWLDRQMATPQIDRRTLQPPQANADVN